MTKKIAISAVLFLLGLIIMTHAHVVEVFDLSPIVHVTALMAVMFGGGAVSMVGAYIFASETSTH